MLSIFAPGITRLFALLRFLVWCVDLVQKTLREQEEFGKETKKTQRKSNMYLELRIKTRIVRQKCLYSMFPERWKVKTYIIRNNTHCQKYDSIALFI